MDSTDKIRIITYYRYSMKLNSSSIIIFTPSSARAGYDTRSIFKQSFPSPRLVASPRLKNLVCPTMYP